MPETITYYALVDSHTSQAQPRTVFRRIRNEEGRDDELFSRDLIWESSPLLQGFERGDTMLDFIPIPEAEAATIVERIKAEAADQK
jgi:hypothetical protein